MQQQSQEHQQLQKQQQQDYQQLPKQQQQQQQYSFSNLKFSNSSSNLKNSSLNRERLDSIPFQIDSLNNNNNNNSNNENNLFININKNSEKRSSFDAKHIAKFDLGQDIESYKDKKNLKKSSMKRNYSLINFKSFDFHIKSIYSGLRSKGSSSQRNSPSDPEKGITTTKVKNNENNKSNNGGSQTSIVKTTRKMPYVKVETVDQDETETLLLTYPQSPYQTRRSSYDNDKSSSQLLNIQPFENTRSQVSSPFLCPSPLPGTVRRSSTSDIMSGPGGKRTGSNSANNSRRPSTSDLLRKARERKGSESGGTGMMGRSISHSGLPRGGYRGGRRTSIAF